MRRGADEGHPVRVVFAPPEAWEGDLVSLAGDEHHHLTRVLRHRRGDRIEAVDGRGGRALLEILEVGRSATRCGIIERRAPEPPPRFAVRLVPCLARGPRMDWLVEKAAELGIEEIVPVASARSVVRRDARGAAAHRARWERLVLSAMKQSRRARRPSVAAPAPLSAYLDQRDRGERLIAPWEGAAGRTLGAHLAERPIAAGSSVALLVGPEGGLTDDESAAIAAAGGEIVRLGRAILRTETAALVGLAILMSAGGEL